MSKPSSTNHAGESPAPAAPSRLTNITRTTAEMDAEPTIELEPMISSITAMQSAAIDQIARTITGLNNAFEVGYAFRHSRPLYNGRHGKCTVVVWRCENQMFRGYVEVASIPNTYHYVSDFSTGCTAHIVCTRIY